MYSKFSKLSRRAFLEATGVALGGLALGSAVPGTLTGKPPPTQPCADNGCGYPVDPKSTLRYNYPDRLRKFTLDMQPNLADDEMRITFLGTMGGPPVRRAQQQMSIFVEVGPWKEDPGGGFGKAKDSFVFDCGLPSTLKARLRDYQVEGYQWLARLAALGIGACLADDMGLGKNPAGPGHHFEKGP